MNKRIYEFLKLILCFIIFFYIGDISVFILKLVGINMNEVGARGMVIYQFVMSLIILVVLGSMYINSIKKDYIEFKKDISKNITYIVKTFVIFMMVKYAVSFLSVVLMMIMGFDTSSMTSVNQNLIETYVKASPILMFFSTAVFAPIYEEVLFRLGIKKAIKKRGLFIIISGFIFGLMHVFPLEDGISLALGLIQSISYVTMGLFLAYVYDEKNNIFSSIGLHFLNNLLSILMMINML